MLFGRTPDVNRFVGNGNLCPGTGGGKTKSRENAPISRVPELEHFVFPFFLSFSCVCISSTVYSSTACRETHPQGEKAEKAELENEIKVIDRLPVASLVDATPPRPTSVSHPQLW